MGHFENESHFEFENMRNEFLVPTNMEMKLLHDSLCQFIKVLRCSKFVAAIFEKKNAIYKYFSKIYKVSSCIFLQCIV